MILEVFSKLNDFTIKKKNQKEAEKGSIIEENAEKLDNLQSENYFAVLETFWSNDQLINDSCDFTIPYSWTCHLI